MHQTWNLKKNHPVGQRTLAESLNISPVIAQLLINRGIVDKDLAHEFLTADRNHLIDPFRFNEMGPAVGRIRQAVARGEKIMLYGDYDVDGITGTALLYLILKGLQAKVTPYIPHRVKEGYGIHDEPIRMAKLQGVTLLITIDCGTSEAARIEWAHKMGIETIILDHHEPKERLPSAALCLINPKIPGEGYPFRELTSVGLAFKLACALTSTAQAAEHLDLVALGTICDVAPLVGENRILVKHGLQTIAHSEKKGIRELAQVAGLKRKKLRADHVGFALGPRINASGRMGSGFRAFQLLTTDHPQEARDLAGQLEAENKERQKCERRIVSEAVRKVEIECQFTKDQVIVVWDDRWHLGVVGIVAARLANRYHRPAVVIAMEGDRGRGSGRSAGTFHLLEAVDQCSEHLTRFGGHAYAIGLEIARESLEPFRDKLNQVTQSTIQQADLIPSIDIDMELELTTLNRPFLEELDRLGPYGEQNPRPKFLSKQVQVLKKPTLIGREGIKFWVEDGGMRGEVVGFRHRHLTPLIQEKTALDVVYTPEIANWDGRESLQLSLHGLKRSDQK